MDDPAWGGVRLMPAKKAAEAEVTGDSLSVEWDGHTYEIPSSLDDCDIEVIEAIESGRSAAMVAGVFGAVQWRQLKARSRPKGRDLDVLCDLVADAYGFKGAGE